MSIRFSRGWRNAAVFALALAIGFVVDDWGMNASYHLGVASGEVFLALMLASVVLAWRRSTRAYIPLATLGLVVVMQDLPSTSEEDRQVMAADLAALRAMARDPWSAPTIPDSTSEPSGSEARSLRVMWSAAADVRNWMVSLAAEYRVGPGREPDLTAAYLADAGRYPEVGDYYRRCAEYARRVRLEMASRLDSVTRHHLEEQALSPRYIEPIRKGQQEALRDSRGGLVNAEQMCHETVQLHAYLVRVDGRVHLGPDETALFEDPDEEKHVRTLLDNVGARADQFPADKVTRLLDSGTVLDSLTKLFLPPQPAPPASRPTPRSEPTDSTRAAPASHRSTLLTPPVLPPPPRTPTTA